STQVSLKPRQKTPEAINIVPTLAEAMRLARVDHQLGRHAMILQGSEELVALADRHNRILSAMHDQRRSGDPINIVDGRKTIIAASLLVGVGTVGDLIPGADLGYAVERAPVTNARSHQCCLEARGLCHGPGGDKAAVAPATDPQPLWVGDAQRDHMIHAGNN